MRSQVLEFRLCPHCTTLMPLNAGRCTRCGRAAAATALPAESRGRLKRTLSRMRESWYVRKNVALCLCPNCFIAMPKGAQQCGHCNWSRLAGEESAPLSRRQRLVRALRAACTYERIVPCTYCERKVRATADFCPACLNPFEAKQAPPSPLARAGTQIRRRQAQKAVERGTLCPICDIFLPAKSNTCFCCGWSSTDESVARPSLRTAVENTRRNLDRTVRRTLLRAKTQGDLCPNCDVCVPRTDTMCMICGWEPTTRRAFSARLRERRAERVHLAAIAKQKRQPVCPECDLPILPKYPNCMVCGWEPAPSLLRRLLAVRLPRPRVFAGSEQQRLCPNCRMPIANDARHCADCGWDRDPSRTWARHPRMIWLVPICLILYVTLLTTFLRMADPLNSHGTVDQYGRTHQEESVKQLTSERSRH